MAAPLHGFGYVSIEVPVWWWTVAFAAEPPCDPTALAQLAAAVDQAEPGRRVSLAAAGLAKACPRDTVLAQQLAQIPTAPPEHWWVIELQTSLIGGWAWNQACSGGTLALSMATKLDPADRRPHLWTACTLEPLGLFTAEEWNTAPGLLVLPILAARTLGETQAPLAQRRSLVRALAGW